MIKYLLPLTLVSLLVFSSCEITIGGGDEKEVETEENELKNGFSYGYEEVTINGMQTVKNHEIIAGEYLFLKYKDLSDATVKDDFIHVGIAFKMYDSDGGLIDESNDLMGNVEQQDPTLNYAEAYFLIPSRDDYEEVRLVTTLFDKYGTVSYEFDQVYTIVNKAPPVTKGVKFNTNMKSLELAGQVFFTKTQFESAPVSINEGDELYFYINGINGFDLIDDEVSISFNMSIRDESGELMYEKDDNISGSVAGLENYPVYFNITFADFDPGTYTWIVNTKDNRSDNFVESSVEVIILD